MPDSQWTWGHKYDQMAIKSYSAENVKLGVYDTDGTLPENLISAESAHSIGAGSYTLLGRTEFALPNSAPWLSFQAQSDNNFYFKGGGVRAMRTQSYSTTWADPANTSSTGTDDCQMKLAHS